MALQITSFGEMSYSKNIMALNVANSMSIFEKLMLFLITFHIMLIKTTELETGLQQLFIVLWDWILLFLFVFYSDTYNLQEN